MRPLLDRVFARISRAMKPRWICLAPTIVLGALAGLITAIMTALVLVEAISFLPLDRRTQVGVVVIACFAIGFGAGLPHLECPRTSSCCPPWTPISGP